MKTKQEKQTRIAVIAMIILIGIFLISYFTFNYYIHNKGTFSYKGIDFKKIKQGEIDFYIAQLNYKDMFGNVANTLNFGFRQNPKSLERIPIQGKIELKPTTVVDVENLFYEGCEDAGLAGANLLSFLKYGGINLYQGTINQTYAEKGNLTLVNCNDENTYSIIILKNSTKSEIRREGECYYLEAKNCEIQNVTERFMIQAYLSSQGEK